MLSMKSLRPLARLAVEAPARSLPRRAFATSLRAAQQNASSSESASYAQTDDSVKNDYPSASEVDDIGHSTTGPGVGKHNQRTLASFSTTGKVCVVTGAARGLGNMFARTFAESGSNSIVLMDLDGKLAQEAAKDLEEWFVSHGQAKPHEIQAIGIGCNVANEDEVKKAMADIVKKFGRIDVLVTAAGIVHNYPATEYPTEKMKQLFSINVDGTFYCAREAAKDMMRRNAPGSIILVGSMSGSVVNVPQPQTPYNASKSAIKHMAASLAVEWAKKGIRVNCLSPGYMATSLTRTILDNNPDLRATWESLTPMGRVGEPEDLKGAIVYLASDASNFTTGVDLLVDGGYTLT